MLTRGFRLGTSYEGLHDSIPAIRSYGVKIGTYVDLERDFRDHAEPLPFRWTPAPWNPIDVASTSQDPAAGSSAPPVGPSPSPATDAPSAALAAEP